jgi:Phospholipase_D-nuclease N-terminal
MFTSPKKRKWADLSAAQRRAVYAGGAVEAVLTSMALRDLARRPAVEVRGPKALWVLALFVQPVGPLAYFIAGRAPA